MTTLHRWREPLVYGVALLGGLRVLWIGYRYESWVMGVLGLGLTGAFVTLLYIALVRAGLRSTTDGPGLVEIDERNITYLAPHLGGTVTIDSIRKIDISPNRVGGHSWVLYHTEGTPLLIPFAAAGADGLLEAFSALPGMRLETIRRATGNKALEIKTVWVRPN